MRGVNTQRNHWKTMFKSVPTKENWTDENLANFVADRCEKHLNPSQRKTILSFLKHTAALLGIPNPNRLDQQTQYPLLQQQIVGIKARPRYKAHVPEKKEPFTAEEYTETLVHLYDVFVRAKAKPQPALELAIFIAMTDAHNRPLHMKNSKNVKCGPIYPLKSVGPRHFLGVASWTKTAQNQSARRIAQPKESKVCI
jgi:hypothetical protein